MNLMEIRICEMCGKKFKCRQKSKRKTCCMDCSKERARKSYQRPEVKARKRKYQREYRQKNKEKIRDRKKLLNG